MSIAAGIGAGSASALLAIAFGLYPFAAVFLLVGVSILIPFFTDNALLRLTPLTIVVISPSVVLGGSGGESALPADGLQKAFLLFCVLALVLASGARPSALSFFALLSLGFAFAVSVVPLSSDIEVDQLGALRAFLGYSLPWLLLLVNWTSMNATDVWRWLASLPTVCLGVGVLLQVFGISSVIVREADGVTRLQGGSIPAHLAMLSFIAVIATVLLIIFGAHTRLTAGALVANLSILLATGTRGAIGAVLLVVVFFAFSALRQSSGLSRRARLGGVAVLLLSVVGLAVTLPELIERSRGNAYEGAFNTSGRDAAWRFYSSLAEQSPGFGKGLGFSAIANERYKPAGVQSVFQAPHNEYLHLLLDGGIVLLVAYVASMVTLFVLAVRRGPPQIKAVVAGCGVAMAIYSYADNTISTPQLTIPLFVLLAPLLSERGTRSSSVGAKASWHELTNDQRNPTVLQLRLDTPASNQKYP